MRTYYKNNLKQSYLILEAEEIDVDDYQIDMLRENEIEGILNMEVRYIDNLCHYYYDISGKTSFQILHEKVRLTYADMKKLVSELVKTLWNLQRYMLDGNFILLDPEYIYYDKKQFYFCYYPHLDKESRDEFHKLTEFFVREVDYRDEEGVHFAYTLHKATMEENYSLEQIMEEFALTEEEEVHMVDYVEQMEQKEPEENVVEEKNDIWHVVKQIWKKAKSYCFDEEEEDL